MQSQKLYASNMYLWCQQINEETGNRRPIELAILTKAEKENEEKLSESKQDTESASSSKGWYMNSSICSCSSRAVCLT
jgi:hypothetical protein